MNQAGINLGFFMVLPYLAAYLTDGLAITAATVGLVLGTRTLRQQGLFLPSGALVDPVGPWPSIVAECGLRVVAFRMLSVLRDPVSVVVSVLLSGVAGALISPDARSYLALESPDRRAENFAAFEVWATSARSSGRCSMPALCCSPTSRPCAWSASSRLVRVALLAGLAAFLGRCLPLLTAATPHTNCTPTLVSPNCMATPAVHGAGVPPEAANRPTGGR